MSWRASFAGVGALTWLTGQRLKARARQRLRDCRRPLRLIIFLIAVAAVVVIATMPARVAARERGLAEGGVPALSSFLMLLPLLSAWTALRQGVLAFRPEEVHFLFPAPVTSRALLLSHLIATFGKSFTGAFMFALFLRPAGASFATVTLGYGLYLAFCVLLQVSVDLGCLRWPAAVRRLRAQWLLLAMLAVLSSTVAMTWFVDGQVWLGWVTLRFATLPVLPFATVISGGLLQGGLPYGIGLGAALVFIVLLAVRVLRFRGDVREAAHQASLVQAKALASVRAGRAFSDAPRAEVRGTLLPMLPHLGGAGIHAWRQLTLLLRTRKSYAMLLLMTLAAGATVGISQPDEPAAAGLVMLSVLVFAGPMIVQCDFRSDYECLPWLRTLPTPPGVLAAGQMLASALVLYALQLVLTGWTMLVCPPEQRLALIGLYVALPVFDMLQLSVWNGAHLLSPLRPGAEQGTPGATAVLRMYVVMIAIMGTIAVALGISGALAAGTWFGLPWLGIEDGAVRRTGAFLVGIAALTTVTSIFVWCVGRLFLRVDGGRDLTD